MWKLKIKLCQKHKISIFLQTIMWASVRGLSLAGREKNLQRKILLVKIANSTYWYICCAEKFLRDSCFQELTGKPPTSAAVGKGTSVPSSWEHHICNAGFVTYSTGKAVLKGTLRARKRISHSIKEKKLNVVLVSCWKQAYLHTYFSLNNFFSHF